MARFIYECDQFQIAAYNMTVLSVSIECPQEAPVCCNKHCCLIYRYHRDIWETWYFWCAVVLICLFLLTTFFSYALSMCKRKQHNLIRIRNVASPANTYPMITTISGPGGIIQPRIYYKDKMGPTATIIIDNNAELTLEDFAGPLDPPYPSIQPVTIVRGNAPPHGYRQTTNYTELVLPPGFVDTDFKRPV